MWVAWIFSWYWTLSKVMRSCHYAYQNGRNITLEALQGELVRTINHKFAGVKTMEKKLIKA
jgi:hypothetical protein